MIKQLQNSGYTNYDKPFGYTIIDSLHTKMSFLVLTINLKNKSYGIKKYTTQVNLREKWFKFFEFKKKRRKKIKHIFFLKNWIIFLTFLNCVIGTCNVNVLLLYTVKWSSQGCAGASNIKPIKLKLLCECNEQIDPQVSPSVAAFN